VIFCSACAESGNSATPVVVGTERPTSVPASAQRAVVDRIVDGDTMWVRPSSAGRLPVGRRAKVRLLEYDAPETGECFFGEATRELARLAPVGATVWLAADREPADRYGRALRYVWRADGVFIDLEMVRRGMGRALLVRPNDAHITQMRQAERQAISARRGLWGGC
jgi:micrococcal nuclease